MDGLVRERVVELRRRGQTYGQIAKETGVGRNSVKSVCRRDNIEPEAQTEVMCPQCQVVLDGLPGRRFCSAACRLAWWHAHPERLNKQAIYTFTCAACGQEFSAYGNRGRKYCSHACYIRHRFGTRGGRG